jgi:putative peptidoglycan lipid II flippase
VTVPRKIVDGVRAILDRFVPRGAILLSILTFAAYVMGLVRDRELTQTFGAGSGELDAYLAAFILPSVFFSVIVASGLTAPFIPIFTGLRRDSTESAYAFGQTILTLAVLAMGIVAGILFVLAPLTVEIVAPGFGPGQRELYIGLFRIACLTQVLFAASTALGEVLVAERRFFFYGIGPMLYSLGITVGTVTLAGRFGIYAPAIGAVLGASLHLGVRVLGTLRTGFQIRPRLGVRTRAIAGFFRLAIPKVGSAPIEPLTFLFFTRVASTLAVGTITTFNIAENFHAVPVSLIGIAFSVAAFPGLSAAYAAADRGEYIRLVRMNLVTIGVLTTLAAVGLAIVGPFAIDVFFGGGNFDADDVARTSALLIVFALAVPFESLGHLASRAIYASRHTLMQVVASILGFGVTVAATLLAVPLIGAVAIPFGFAFGVAVRLVLLLVVLAWRIRIMSGVPAHLVDEGVAAAGAD